MYSYKLNKSRDMDFFSAPHYDAISTALLKDGDVICVCNDCEELFLQSSWEANDKKCSKCSCSSRKNIDEKYFERYKIQFQRVVSTRNRVAVSTRRRAITPIGTVVDPTQTVTAVRRQPVQNSFGTNTEMLSQTTSAVTRRPVTSRNSSTAQNGSSRQTIRSQPYPLKTKRRKKTGRILLGIVISLLVIALLIGTAAVLHFTGVVDLLPAMVEAKNILCDLPGEPLSIGFVNGFLQLFV